SADGADREEIPSDAENYSACLFCHHRLLHCRRLFSDFIAYVQFSPYDLRRRTMKRLKNQKGFTLIEMLIVMLIITVLIAIAIPNVTKQTSAVEDKGCKAYVHMVQGQVESYRMD